jgi:KaiC/GvpD/RAD55 family RecA-like ATPase|tara:strand:+ start:256 stop:1221 length:966 start_codon:yes stop_codon:yes gene_type:complete
MDVLTPEQVTARLAAVHGGEAGGSPSEKKAPRRWSATTAVVDNLVGFIRNPAERWYMGFPEIDLATRGIGRGEVLLVVGRSHTGKSQVLLNGIVTNLINDPSAHVVIFAMDEPRELVVMKLFCLLQGKSSTEVEEAIKAGDKKILSQLNEAAANELSRVAVVDDSISLETMGDVMEEARQWWGCDLSFCMMDYLELLPGGDADSGGVTSKAQAVKRWAKTQRVPIGLVHQAGRGAGQPGQAAGIHAGRYGGEQEAIFVVEVYRKRDRTDLSDGEKAYHANSVNLNLCKNKRTARLLDQIYYLDPECGHVHPYWEELVPSNG